MCLIHKTLVKGNRKIQKRKIEGFQEIERLRKKQGIFVRINPVLETVQVLCQNDGLSPSAAE